MSHIALSLIFLETVVHHREFLRLSCDQRLGMDRTRPNCYIERIITPALIFKQLKWAGCDLMYFYISVVHLILEYACPLPSVAHRINSCAVWRAVVRQESRHVHHILWWQQWQLQDPYNHFWRRHTDGEKTSADWEIFQETCSSQQLTSSLSTPRSAWQWHC